MKKRDTLTLSMLIAASIQPIRASLVSVENMEHYKKIINTQTPTVLVYSAEWCGACKNLKEPLQRLVDNPAHKHITFAKVDIDAHRDIAQQEGIEAVPTLRLMQNGEQKNEIRGLPQDTEKTLNTELEKAFNTKKSVPAPQSESDTMHILPVEEDAQTMTIMEQPVAPEKKDVPQTPIMNFVKYVLNSLIAIVNYIVCLVKQGFNSIGSFFTKS